MTTKVFKKSSKLSIIVLSIQIISFSFVNYFKIILVKLRVINNYNLDKINIKNVTNLIVKSIVHHFNKIYKINIILGIFLKHL